MSGPSSLLPVQCCCEPDKRLGWVSVPRASGGPVKFAVLSPVLIADRYSDRVEVLDTEIKVHQRVAYPARLLDCGCYTVALVVKRLAVSSHEYPIETWRRVSGFTEGQEMPKC